MQIERILSVFSGIAGLAVLLFGFAECFVLSGFRAKGHPGLDYLVVLGAKADVNGPSCSLAQRLETAAVYLQQNPHTHCIVSGGQRADEQVTEAAVMKAYLLQKGIDETRIITEDRSKNTRENISYSAAFFPAEMSSVGIVTSNFHIYRSLRTARREGWTDVCGLAAKTNPRYLLRGMLREGAGVLKDWLR